MNSTIKNNRLMFLLAAGLVFGEGIAAIDNLAFEGEVSPIVIVAMLFFVTAMFGGLWSWRGALASVVAWMCVPLAHLVKHVLGMPDTLQPNTYASILLLAGFTWTVATLGTGCGILVHKLTTKHETG